MELSLKNEKKNCSLKLIKVRGKSRDTSTLNLGNLRPTFSLEKDSLISPVMEFVLSQLLISLS
jgi:hypothetical protein